MIKSDILNLYRNLNKLGYHVGVKFAYAVAKNMNMLKPEVQALEKALEMSPEYKEFENKRIELVESYAKKNESGKPVFDKVKNSYDIEEGKEEVLNKEFEKLKAKNKKLFDARTKQIDEYNALLKTEIKIKLYTVPLSVVPETITTQQMHSIFDMIEDDGEEPKKIDLGKEKKK